MRIKTLVEFSGVPKNTTGYCEEDKDDWHDGKKMWKVTWDLTTRKSKPLVDWFDQGEFDRFLVEI